MPVFIYLSLSIRRFTSSKRGAVAVEYAFLAAFVAIAAAIGMVLVGPNMEAFFVDTGTAILNAGSNIPIPIAT